MLLQEIEGEKAEELVKKCPVKVFDIEEMGKGNVSCCTNTISYIIPLLLYLICACPQLLLCKNVAIGRKKATVARPRSCTLCRECIRGDEWDKLVSLRRVKNHFICK